MVNKVNVQAIYYRLVLIKAIQHRLLRAPIEIVFPIVQQAL